jgi:hypothetical protein
MWRDRLLQFPTVSFVFSVNTRRIECRALEEQAKLGGPQPAPCPKGIGYAVNQAILQSSGAFLCRMDADDIMVRVVTRVS